MLGIFAGQIFHIVQLFVIISWLFVFVLLLFFHQRQQTLLKKEVFFVIFVFLLSFLSGILLFKRADKRQNKHHYTRYLAKDSTIYLKILLIKKLRTTKRLNFIGCVVQVNSTKTTGDILLHFPLQSNEISVGDNILVYMDSKHIKKPRKALNPNFFDYRKYLQTQQIYREINLQHTAYYIDSETANWYKIIATIRQKAQRYFSSGGLSHQELAFANTVLLGERQDVSPENFRDFQSAGTMHILAVSGLHVGILLLFLHIFLYPVKRFSLLVFLILSIGFLWFYALLSGFSPSVVRAVLMFSLFQLGFYIQRKNNPYNILFVTAFLMLLYNPYYLFQVGFQLSFLAVLGIISFFPFLNRLFHSKYQIIQWWLDLLSLSIAAQLTVLPLSLYYFHQFPLYFWLANLLVVPLLIIVLFIGFVLLIFSLLNIKTVFIFKAFSFLTACLLQINHLIGELPFALFENIRFSKWQLMLFMMILLFLYYYLKKPRNYYRLTVLLLVILVFQGLVLIQRELYKAQHSYMVLHQYRTAVVAEKKSDKLHFFQAQEKINPYLLKNMYLFYPEIQFDSLPVFQGFAGKKILHIDSLGIYSFENFHPDIVVLHYSPKINFDRMLKVLQPKQVVFDASDKFYLIERWKKSAIKYQTDFYDVNTQGAYILSK